jgi:hypothetical protein
MKMKVWSILSVMINETWPQGSSSLKQITVVFLISPKTVQQNQGPSTCCVSHKCIVIVLALEIHVGVCMISVPSADRHNCLVVTERGQLLWKDYIILYCFLLFITWCSLEVFFLPENFKFFLALYKAPSEFRSKWTNFTPTYSFQR